jgi:hypothetical protein
VDFPSPPPSEQAAAREDHAGQTSASDGAGPGRLQCANQMDIAQTITATAAINPAQARGELATGFKAGHGGGAILTLPPSSLNDIEGALPALL